MSGELVFTVAGSVATPAEPISLADAGLRERSDLQEWVLAHPEIVGPGVLIVGFEYDRWRAIQSGERERDRLDVLGIDTEGRLVVAELKRDRAPDTVQMQAIKYAAMASRFTDETLVGLYARFRGTQGQPLDEDDARSELIEHAGELDITQLRRPRIVLVAGEFPPVVTSTAVWLTEMGLDITMQRVQAYRVFGEQTIVTVSQLFPVPDVEEFTVAPERAAAQETRQRRRRRKENTVSRLVATQVLPDGTALALSPTNEVDAAVRERLQTWLDEDPRRGRARWHNDATAPIEWEYDGRAYKPTPLVVQILNEVTENPRTSLAGPRWWTTEDGRDLPTVAGIVPGRSFDWTALHHVLENLPAGRWTTYGDLAQVVGTAAMPLGQHVASCPDCPRAYRVLGGEGRIRPNFSWGDAANQQDPVDVLQAEGVRFIDGVADADQRMTVEELKAIANR